MEARLVLHLLHERNCRAPAGSMSALDALRFFFILKTPTSTSTHYSKCRCRSFFSLPSRGENCGRSTCNPNCSLRRIVVFVARPRLALALPRRARLPFFPRLRRRKGYYELSSPYRRRHQGCFAGAQGLTGTLHQYVDLCSFPFVVAAWRPRVRVALAKPHISAYEHKLLALTIGM